MLHLDFKKILALAVKKEKEFFPSDVPRELKELYLTMTLLNFALAAGMLFEPIYLYTLHYSLSEIMLYYFFVYALYFFLIPLGGKFVKKRGFEHGIILGSIFLVIYFILLINIPQFPPCFFLAIVALALQKAFFWPGYHADFIFFSKAQERGREVGVLSTLDALSFVFGPLIGGAAIYFFGFAGLFTVMCIMILLSNIPLMTTKEIFKPSGLSYKASYKNLVAKENRQYLLGYIGFGEELIALTIWPIFIYLTFQNFVSTGAAITFSTLVTALAIIVVGRLTDSSDRKLLLRLSTILLSCSWFFRLMIQGGSSVIFSDFFSRTAKYVFNLPMISGLYKHATRTSIVSTVIFFEMALTVGKMIAALLMAALFFFMPSAWNVAFFIAGLFSLLYFFLSKKDHHVVISEPACGRQEIGNPEKLV